MNITDTACDSLLFSRNLITQLSELEPGYQWLIVPDGDPGTVAVYGDAPYSFIVLCRKAGHERDPVGCFAAVLCDGESCVRAADRTEWARSVANKALAQLSHC